MPIRYRFLDSALTQDLTNAILLVVGDMPIDNDAPVVISSISKICRLISLSEVLIEIELLYACVSRRSVRTSMWASTSVDAAGARFTFRGQSGVLHSEHVRCDDLKIKCILLVIKNR
jgi:hypothetical protein